MSISENIELSYDLFDIEIPRTASINFYQRIIEDLTGYDVLSIVYNQDQECIIAVFTNLYLPRLIINVAGDSLPACTRDVIRQTQLWIERQRKKSQVD